MVHLLRCARDSEHGSRQLEAPRVRLRSIRQLLSVPEASPLMSGPSLEEKFPDLTPIAGSPNLHSVNGIGFCIYGNRDHDEESATYVKTRCFCVFFVPIVAVDAYRVANASEGWFFLGKVPLSRLAFGWN